MAKRDYYLIIDTETTQDSLVADFGAVLTTRTGKAVKQCAVLIDTIYKDCDNHPLFYTSDPDDEIFGGHTVDRRYGMYEKMLKGGTRMLASVAAVNRWLEKIDSEFKPYITAYNFPFDRSKCANTGIDLTIFKDRYFCLWAASINKWGANKRFRQFCLEQHAFNPPTEKGNMTFKTNAEIMCRFVTNNPSLEDEPHTALEDVLYYELPILKKLLTTTSKKNILNAESYNWRNFQVRDAFIAK